MFICLYVYMFICLSVYIYREWGAVRPAPAHPDDSSHWLYNRGNSQRLLSLAMVLADAPPTRANLPVGCESLHRFPSSPAARAREGPPAGNREAVAALACGRPAPGDLEWLELPGMV